jgi:hypothetical protein
MEAMSTAAIAVPLDDDGAHVVIEHLARYPAECEERVLVCRDQGLDPLVGEKLDIARPARKRSARTPSQAAASAVSRGSQFQGSSSAMCRAG